MQAIHTMPISVTDIPEGSAIKILGTDDDGQEETWYGQVYGVDPNANTVEVALMVPHGNSYEFDKGGYSPQYVPVESILAYEPIEPIDSLRSHKKAWYRIGLRLVHSTADKDQFVELSDTTTLQDIGDEEADYNSADDADWADDESMGSLKDFIVDDDEADEPFTHAEPTNEFVKDTHQAVHDFNDWVPSSEREEGVKSFIERLENKYVHSDSDRHFKHGRSGPSYSKPKI